MKARIFPLFVGAGLALMLAGSQPLAADKQGAAACFEQMKSLAGEWVGKDPTGMDKSGKEIVLLRYRVTAGGSALEETEFPGTPHEMMTVFHLDGDHLMLTHYCHLGNQPRMRATADSTPTAINFECAGVGNSGSHGEAHMHAAKFRFPSKDKLEAEWTLSEDEKPGFVARFTATRKP